MKNYQSCYNYSLVIGFAAVIFINVWCFGFLSDMQRNQHLSLTYTNNNIDTLNRNQKTQQKLIEYTLKRSIEHQNILIDYNEEFVKVYDVIFKLAVMDGEQHADHEERILELNRNFLEAFGGLVRDYEEQNVRLKKIESLLIYKK